VNISSKSAIIKAFTRLSALFLFAALVSGFAAGTEIESGHIQVTSAGTITEDIGFRPDYIEFITAQQIESNNFHESDPTNDDCPDNVNGWSEGSVIFDNTGVDEQYAIGMFRNSDSTNGHRTTSSTSDVIKNSYSDQDGYQCGKLEISVDSPNSNGFTVNVETKYGSYDEIVRYKAYQFPDNMEFDAGMKEINSEGDVNVNLGFQPANLHIRAGQQISSKNSNDRHYREPMGRSKGYATIDEYGSIIDQQSIGTASSSDSTNAHRSLASDQHVLNTVYVDQNANVQGRLEGRISNADSNGFTMDVETKTYGSDEIFLYRAWGQSYYEYDVGYTVYGYRNWDSDEPNDSGGDEDCAVTNWDNGGWNDLGCGDSEEGICEYGGGNYNQTSTTDWNSAKTTCENWGGHLAIINNQNENDYLQNNFGSEKWIGLSQNSGGSEPAGGWTWIDPGAGKFDIGFEPDAVDIYAEQQISSINEEVLTPSNSGCANAGGWSNGFYETADNSQWALSTGRTSDSQNSHRYGSTTSSALRNLYSNQGGGNCGEFEGTVTDTSSSGFTMDFATRDGFENNYGQEMVYYRAFNFLKAPPTIESIEFYNSSDEHAFGLIANITEGSNDISTCQITAESSSGNSQTYSGTATQINDTHSQCLYEWIEYDDNSNWENRHDTNDDLLNLDVTVEAGDVDGLTDDKTESHRFPNHEPEPVVESSSFINYNDRHAFNISAEIVYPDDSEHEPLGGENGDRGCQIFLEGENGNNYDSGDGPGSGDFDVELNYQGSDYALCEFSRVEPSSYGGLFDFQVEEEVNVTVMARDHHGEEVNSSALHVIPNRPPVVSLQSPSDGSLELNRDVDLEVFIDDPEGDNIEQLEFVNDVTGEKIDVQNNLGQGSHSTEWSDLDLGNYEWRVNVSDPYEHQESGIREFFRVISKIYRVQHEIQHDYSTLIVDENDSAFIFLETSVNTDAREFTTYLDGDGINAEFRENGQNSKTYNIEPDSPVRHQLRINGVQTGNTELKIVTEDDSVDVNTSKTFPVYVRDSVEEGQPVPGLTSFYMLIITLFSATLYFVSL